MFAVNITHAISLNKLFTKAGIKSDYIVSDIRDLITGVTISRKDNERKLQEYREGKLQVLINVNILTEGVDLPQTKTVFLARPTVSKILMTQMIGRALRGTAAGGTSEAHIVSFVDKWNENIAWCNPVSLFSGEGEFNDVESDRNKNQINLIAISKIEEFAAMLDDTIDTTAIESIPFIKRIPIGMYAFTYLTEDGMDLTYQVMVYDSTKDAYKMLMNSLSDLFKEYNVDEEYPSKEILEELEEQCRSIYFCGEMVPPYESRDIIHILKYYAQFDEAPMFYTFDEIDKNKLDISSIAQYIVDEDMGPRKKSEYLEKIWENKDDNLLRLFFGRKIYFIKQIDLEMLKITDKDIFIEESNVKYGKRCFEDMPLSEIGKIAPDVEKELRDKTFEAALNDKGLYECAICKKAFSNRIPLQIDHIIPMNKGGKTTEDNLQVLCRQCNGLKSDSLEVSN